MIVFTITRPDGDVETLKTSRTKLTVGGAYTDDITLLGLGAVTEYGTFSITDEKVVYTDNGYGSFVNDREIVEETIPLSPDDTLRIGNDTITYALDSEKVVTSHDIPSFEAVFTETEPLHSPKPIHPAPPTFPPSSVDTAELSLSTDSTPSQESSRPESDPFLILPDFLPECIKIRTPEPIKENKKEYIIGSVVLVLMSFFWLIGFVANLIAWGYMSKDAQAEEERPLFYGCVGMLLFLNLIILGIYVLYYIIQIVIAIL